MEPEGSLPYSQLPATCPYPEPTLSSPHTPLQPPEDPCPVLNQINPVHEPAALQPVWALMNRRISFHRRESNYEFSVVQPMAR
jgi:hypothetical protein